MVALIAFFILTWNLLATIKADSNTTTSCPVQRFYDIMGTSKYILYGLTADCQLFFATNVPDGTDLGKVFGPKPIVTHNPRYCNCKSARLFPMRNANNELKFLLVFVAAPQVYAYVFDYKPPAKDKWYSLITGPNNGSVVSLGPDAMGTMSIISNLNFTKLIDTPAQRQEDLILALVNQTGNEFAFFSRAVNGDPNQMDLNIFAMAADNSLNRTVKIPNMLKQLYALFMDPYKNNMYLIDTSFIMYRYPMSQIGSVSDLNNFGNKDKVTTTNDGHSYNFYIVNDMLFRTKFASPSQANITIQTIYTTLNSTQYALSDIPSRCIGFLSRPNELDYSSLDNFQMSALLNEDYDALSHSAQSGIHENCFLKLLTVVALALFFQI